MIRSLTVDDEAGWRPLWLGYLRFYEADVADATTAKTFARLVDPAEPMFGALAISDGRPVGLVHWLFHRSTWTEGDYCYLQDLFVAGEVRGGGVGRSLIAFCAAAAEARRAARLYWLTHESNVAAMKLYDRVAKRSGFVQYRKPLG